MRIYKGSEITLKLYTRINCQSIEADKMRVVLFTTNPNKSYMVNNVVVSGDTLLVTVGRNDFNAMEDGVINYIILGYDDNEEIYNSTRQSNYYLKTPDGYVAKSIQTSKDVYIVDNGEYKVLPDEDYSSMEEVNVHVELDTEPYIQQGFELGEENQKSKLESISITENGTYSREDGYSQVVVDVPDLNGDYQTGYDEGYEAGIDYVSENAGEIAAQTARVLDITENGLYESQYSEPRLLTPITGKYPNGDNFYDYAYLSTNTGYNTGIFPGPTTRLEFWWRFDGTIEQGGFGEGLIIGAHQWGEYNSIFKIGFNLGATEMQASIYDATIDFPIPDNNWHHYIMSFEDGLVIDGKEIGKFGNNLTGTSTYEPICINSYYNNYHLNADYYGMIKIDDTIFIPTEDGFMNYTTNEFLPLVKVDYKYEYIKSDNINTGEYTDGTPFYDYAEITNYIYNTDIYINNNSIIEFWYKGDGQQTDDGWNQILNAESKSDEWSLALAYTYLDTNKLRLSWGGRNYEIVWDDNVFNHLIISSNGVFLNDEKVVDIENTTFASSVPCVINGMAFSIGSRRANGSFGMIKITTDGVENVIIPTEDGLKNITTNKYLPIVNIPYVYTQVEPEYSKPTGNLIKTVNVNVPPKIDVGKYKIKLGYSTFTEVPDFYDFSNLINAESLFHYCSNLQTISSIDTSNVTNMNNMFANCNLQTIPQLDTSNVTDMSYMFANCHNLQTISSIDTSNVTGMYRMFYRCSNLQTIPQLDTSNVTNMTYMFYEATNLISLPALNATKLTSINHYFGITNLNNLTNVGGWIDLNINWNDDRGLVKCPNLTYQSCINILNGLYDFTGNGEIPTSSQGQLKVHQNFLDTVGDEISIGINKNWTITA